MVREYCMEMGPMGPIGEGEALILRVVRNCPWNKCLFCASYKGKEFGRRSVEEIKRDIDAVRRTEELIRRVFKNVRRLSVIKPEIMNMVVVRTYPEIYGNDYEGLSDEECAARMTLSNVVNWVLNGKRRVFLQDADALMMKPDDLAEVLRYLREVFPSVEVVSSYARSKTCYKRDIEDLRMLRDAGLSWLFVGIESGSDEVLEYMRKGVTAEEHVIGGKKVMGAGINLAAFIMPGLGGKDRGREHVEETIRVLNEMKPTEVRVRSLAILRGTPLYEMWRRGEFRAVTDDDMIEEIREIIEGLRFDCVFETLQMTNVLFNVKGRLSEIKEAMLSVIEWYNMKPPLEKLRYRLYKYLRGGYYDFVKAIGGCDERLEELIEEARISLAEGRGDVAEKVERAIFAIKEKGIP
ncbi:MAG: radical SAM protein [Candidatus Methanospirareceae archaeon]